MGIVAKASSSKPAMMFIRVRSLWFLSSLASVIGLAILVGLLTKAPFLYLIEQLLLGLTVYISIFIISSKHFINHTTVVYFFTGGQ